MDDDTDTRRKAKLYTMDDDRQWDCKGVGRVASIYQRRLEGMCIFVRAVSDGSLLLESKILADTAYLRRQDTLILWTEDNGLEVALNFQERRGCQEIWQAICLVQGKNPSVENTQDIPDTWQVESEE